MKNSTESGELSRAAREFAKSLEWYGLEEQAVAYMAYKEGYKQALKDTNDNPTA